MLNTIQSSIHDNKLILNHNIVISSDYTNKVIDELKKSADLESKDRILKIQLP